MNIHTILSLSNELDKFLSNKDNVIVFYKLLKTECLHNQNLINCLKSDVGQKDTAIIEIINLLEIENLEIYLSGQFKKTSFLAKILDRNIDRQDTNNDDLVANIFLKIKVLKAISTIKTEEKSGFKNFRLKQRLQNLRDKLEELTRELDDRIKSNV